MPVHGRLCSIGAVMVFMLCATAVSTADGDLVVNLGGGEEATAAAPGVVTTTKMIKVDVKFSEAEQARYAAMMTKANEAEDEGVSMKKQSEQLLEEEKKKKEAEQIRILELQGLKEAAAAKDKRDREKVLADMAAKKKALEEAKIKKEADDKSQETRLKAALGAGTESGREAGRLAAVKAAKGYLHELEEKGDKVDNGIKMEIIAQASKAGQQAGSKSGGKGGLFAAARKNKATPKSEEPKKVVRAEKAAEKEGIEIGTQEGKTVGHKAGQSAGLEAATRLWAIKRTNKAKSTGFEMGGKVGKASGAEAGKLAGKKAGFRMATTAVDIMMEQLKGGEWLKKPLKKVKTAELAAMFAARKMGGKLGARFGKRAGATAGEEMGQKMGELAGEEAVKKAKQGGMATKEEDAVGADIAKAKADVVAARVGTAAGKEAGENLDVAALMDRIRQPARDAADEVMLGGHPKLFNRMKHRITNAFLKAGYRASKLPGAAAGEKAAMDAAKKYLAHAKAKLLPKECSLSTTRTKQIAALAAHNGREIGQVEGEKGGISATQKSAKMLKKLEQKKAISLATEHNAKETAKVAAVLAASQAGMLVGTKVATDEIKEELEQCNLCAKARKAPSDEYIEGC